MRRIILLTTLLLAPALAAARPPLAAKRPVVDTYHGVAVTDDYQWLENGDDPEVRAWVTAHSDAAAAHLDGLPTTEANYRRLLALDELRKVSYAPWGFRGGVWFAERRTPGRSHAAIVRLPDLTDVDRAEVLFDPDSYDSTGLTSVDWWAPSHDGKRLAMSLSQRGSEDGTLYVLDLVTRKMLPDRIPRVQYGTAGGDVVWTADSTGVYYTRYPAPGDRPPEDAHFYQEIWFHKLGTPLASDRLVLGGKDLPRIAEILIGSSPTGSRLFAEIRDGDGGRKAYWAIGDGPPKLIARFEDRVVQARYGPDDSLYLLSLDGAPQGKILRLAPGVTSLASATVVLPEGPGRIDELAVTKNRLYVATLHGGPSEARSYPLDGKAGWEQVPAPPVSSVGGLTPLDARASDEILVSIGSYLAPWTTYRWAPGRALEKTALTPAPDVDFSAYEVTRVMARSKDGTQVPMTLLHKKGLKRDGKNPVLLYGYGGYGISETPGFSASRLVWLEKGGVYAFANIRGGAEFGERWHEQGMLLEKQHVFDDFIACAEWLVKNKVTTSRRLAILGGSNGGLLMGAVMTQRPELFAAVVSSVGIYDMLRVERSPNGVFNVTEFGSVKDPKQFAALHAYSPYHRVKDGVAYPPLLLLTGENDPRVDPMQSRKFAARLLAAGAKDVLLLTNKDAGHGIPNREQRLRSTARQFAFLFDRLGMR